VALLAVDRRTPAQASRLFVSELSMLCHVGAEFGSGVDAELAVGAAQVRFDGLWG
jgi:hypothetical protein